MKIYPAIDIYEGGCVRLFQGDFNQKVSYHRDPLEIALGYQAEGAQYLHLVDLDAARSGKLVNLQILERLCNQTSLSINYGGGIKSTEDIRRILDIGAYSVTAGSSAVREPELFIEWLESFGDRLVLSADVNNGQIQIAGWQLSTPFTISDLINKYKSYGLKYVACTDVGKDGTLSGPSTGLYKELLGKFPDINLIASGGVGSISDLKELKSAGLFAAIVGKSLLEGHFKLKDALTSIDSI